MIVMKFGGSSVRDADMFRRVASIIKGRKKRKPIVVVSACQGITDLLLKSIEESIKGELKAYNEIEKKHHAIIKELGLDRNLVEKELNELKNVLIANTVIKEKGPRIKDYIAFFGERISSKILAAVLCARGEKAQAFDSGDLGLITDSTYTNAKILETSYDLMKQRLLPIIQKGIIPVITGFGGKDKTGEYTTFQRGGSDYVASLFGAALDCDEIEIWTDVSGIFSADPRIVASAKSIREISFEEASELAYFGAKVLHPKTILPAVEKNIPVVVLNTFEPQHHGTRVISQPTIREDRIVKAITHKKGITVIEIKSTRMLDAYGYLAKVFAIFEKYKKSVDMLATSEVKISLTIDSEENVEKIENELRSIAEVRVLHKQAIIYAVGEGVKNSSKLAAQLFKTLENANIKAHMASLCYDSISMGIIVDEQKATEAVRALHAELIEKNKLI